jgi:hypothetical protein
MSLRDRLEALTEHREPVFEPSDDPTLVAFSTLFAESGPFALDASKTLRLDALSAIYDCETESQHGAEGSTYRFVTLDPAVTRAGVRATRESRRAAAQC